MRSDLPSAIDWYRDWFADPRYSELYEHRNEQEADELVTLIESVTQINKEYCVLDVACGAGRHLLAFAKRGYANLFGQDLSPTLIAEAASVTTGYPITFSERDMRDTIAGKFDIILNIFTSFGYFSTDEENERVIANCAGALSPGGYFVLDYFNAVYIRMHLVADDVKILSGGMRVKQHRVVEGNRVTKKITFSDGAEFIESVRLYDKEEIEGMFAKYGLATTAVFGSYSGDGFNAAVSPRLILIAQKQ